MPIIISNIDLHIWLEGSINKTNEIINKEPPLDFIAEIFPRKNTSKKSSRENSLID